MQHGEPAGYTCAWAFWDRFEDLRGCKVRVGIASLGNEEAVGGTARKVADVLRLQYPAQPPLGPVLIAELNRRFVAISVNLPCSTHRLQSLHNGPS